MENATTTSISGCSNFLADNCQWTPLRGRWNGSLALVDRHGALGRPLLLPGMFVFLDPPLIVIGDTGRANDSGLDVTAPNLLVEKAPASVSC